jgi:hypothetical protein
MCILSVRCLLYHGELGVVHRKYTMPYDDHGTSDNIVRVYGLCILPFELRRASSRLLLSKEALSKDKEKGRRAGEETIN